jgi:hypothetical protein
MGAGSAASNVTMAFGGTVPVTTDVAGATGATAAVGAASFVGPHATAHADTTRRSAVRMITKPQW